MKKDIARIIRDNLFKEINNDKDMPNQYWFYMSSQFNDNGGDVFLSNQDLFNYIKDLAEGGSSIQEVKLIELSGHTSLQIRGDRKELLEEMNNIIGYE